VRKYALTAAAAWCVAALLNTGTLLATPAYAQDNQASDQGDAKRVTVTAEGYNRDDAVKQALRKALEQGAGVQIASYSQTSDFVLVRDTIYSRAFGLISDYKVLSEKPGAGGTVIVEVEAVVRPSLVVEAWAEVQNLLDQIGRPKIMVWIDERIDGELQRDSIVESRIEELFVKQGFELVTRKAHGEVSDPRRADERDEKGETKLQQIAKEAGAHILIRGSANANRAGLENLYGVPAAFYNCDVQARIYYTDTGKLLASESVPSTRRGVRSRREFSPQAAREALVQATFPDAENASSRRALAIRLFESVMVQWSTIITAGGEIELIVSSLSFKEFVTLKKTLADMEGVKSAEGDFSEGSARFRIKATISASTLAEQLLKPPLDEWLEVTDLKPNRIKATTGH